MVKKGDIITVNQPNVSNTYFVDQVLEEEKCCLVYHPNFPDVFLKKPLTEINKVQANLKNSTEKCLDFSKAFRKYLDYNSSVKLDSLMLYHTVYKRLSPRQKRELSIMCGMIANIYCQHYYNS